MQIVLINKVDEMGSSNARDPAEPAMLFRLRYSGVYVGLWHGVPEEAAKDKTSGHLFRFEIQPHTASTVWCLTTPTLDH